MEIARLMIERFKVGFNELQLRESWARGSMGGAKVHEPVLALCIHF